MVLLNLHTWVIYVIKVTKYANQSFKWNVIWSFLAPFSNTFGEFSANHRVKGFRLTLSEPINCHYRIRCGWAALKEEKKMTAVDDSSIFLLRWSENIFTKIFCCGTKDRWQFVPPVRIGIPPIIPPDRSLCVAKGIGRCEGAPPRMVRPIQSEEPSGKRRKLVCADADQEAAAVCLA